MTVPDDGLISGRYRLGELLGSGGTASVFSAVEVSTGRPLALKILHPHFSAYEAAREAFFREARAAEAMRHPNVVAVLGVGTHDAAGVPSAWIAVELAEGVTLAERVETDGPLTVAQAVAVIEGVLLGLQAAHAAGVIHRDISPSNVMVPAAGSELEAGRVRVLDFGLADAAGRQALGHDVLRSEAVATAGAAAADAADGAGAKAPGVVGNVNYMSPEQARGLTVDERGDLYQVAALAYYAVTGRPPYQRDTQREVMRAHVQAPPPVPSSLRPGVGRGFDRFVVRGLAKDPQGRYPDARTMLDALQAAAPPSTAARTVVLGGLDGAGHDDTEGFGDPDDGATKVLPAASERTVVARHPGLSSVPTRTSAVTVAAGQQPSRRSGWAAASLVAALIVVVWGFAAAYGNPGGPRALPTSIPTATPTTTPTPTATSEPMVVDERPIVPALGGLPLASARSALEAAGLTVGAVTSDDSELAAGTVLRSSAAAGERLAPGTAVDLVVASGSNRVPATAGLALADATALLESAGFVVSVVSRLEPSSPEGSVVASEPAEGVRAALGSTIMLVGAVHPVVPTSTPSATPSPTPSSTPSQTPGSTTSPPPTGDGR
ncbi:protein kinase domain-containing protein [Compostimonas suwonensis]|uniref:non-specific serine/threonine protein kinase n=1 Tax=Compostimonas suwonensis TaxID=1048394 RepID=A0A2M9C3D8_9MICO|nr:PASTA domain-containing protein [Compostimonas suwonensis]PJJ64989.1 serine/threonine-protein kinase [Compostimonas suwonensis]